MNPKTSLGVALVAMIQLAAGASMAAQSCSNWMDQGNGTSWAVCVDDNGVRHCWLISNTPGSTAYEVSCSG
jgi:hypothetical protein